MINYLFVIEPDQEECRPAGLMQLIGPDMGNQIFPTK
jgi:hypothetical protein